MPTFYVVDFIANVRKLILNALKTFGDLARSFLSMILNLSRNADTIHFVYDTYIDGSIKESEEWEDAINLLENLTAIDELTSLPVDMSSFWASGSNKTKLQQFVSTWVVLNSTTECADTRIYLTGMNGEIPSLSHSVYQGHVDYHIELELISIEEADICYNSSCSVLCVKWKSKSYYIIRGY